MVCKIGYDTFRDSAGVAWFSEATDDDLSIPDLQDAATAGVLYTMLLEKTANLTGPRLELYRTEHGYRLVVPTGEAHITSIYNGPTHGIVVARALIDLETHGEEDEEDDAQAQEAPG